MLNKVYEIINVYRNYGPFLSFTMVLRSESIEIVRIDRSLSQDISKGSVFVHDFIKINSITKDGVIFEVVDENNKIVDKQEKQDYTCYLIESIIYGEQSETHYLPFLCDILPYNNLKISSHLAIPIIVSGKFIGKYMINGLEIPNLKFPIPSQFITRICYKTRINIYPNSYNPFFFIIASSNHAWIKIVFWKERLKEYSGLKVGDIIQVKEYKKKRKLPLIEKVEYNTFTESVYFDCEEITAREIVRIEYNAPQVKTSMFNSVEGVITYLSILKRYSCNGMLFEYVLCRICEKRIVLFYNSDENFEKLETGIRVKINEIRRGERCGIEYYVSTIYTQFQIIENKNYESDEKMKMLVRKKENGDASENNWGKGEYKTGDNGVLIETMNFKKLKKNEIFDFNENIKTNDEKVNNIGIKKDSDEISKNSTVNIQEINKKSNDINEINKNEKEGIIKSNNVSNDSNKVINNSNEMNNNNNEESNDNNNKRIDSNEESNDNNNKRIDSNDNNEVINDSNFNEIDIKEIESLFDSSEVIKQRNLKSNKGIMLENIFGGISFLPDNFEDIFSVTDYKVEEQINGRNVSINLFMKPNVIEIEELENISLVLNESKKHIIYDKIIEVSSDILSIGYIDHEVTKNQKSHKIILASKFQCYFFKNFFVNSITINDIKKYIGIKVYLVIESFHVDQNTILHYLTGIIKDKK